MPTNKLKLVCLSNFGGEKTFGDLFNEVIPYSPKLKVTRDMVFLYEGGTDVNPKLYGEKAGRWTQAPDRDRDQRESDIFMTYQGYVQGFIGICRGAQFLNVKNGGGLIQHCNNHTTNHEITVRDPGTGRNKQIKVTSTHHQMIDPQLLSFGKRNIVYGWAEPKPDSFYLNGKDDFLEGIHVEPEIVWFPETKSLCIQGHPEYMRNEEEFPVYCRELVSALF